MKEKSYYKKLKAQKDELISMGWEEVLTIESGKKKRRWKHENYDCTFSVNGAYKIARSKSSEEELKEVKQVLNKVIDAHNALSQRVAKLESANENCSSPI